MASLTRYGTPAVTRAFKVNRFEAHPTKKELIIRGEVVATFVNKTTERFIAQETRDFYKSVKLEGLGKGSDVISIVDDILKAFPYLEEAILRDSEIVVSLIEELKLRTFERNGALSPFKTNAFDEEDDFLSPFELQLPDYVEDNLDFNDAETDGKEDISLGNLENYVELLYEEIPEKAKGAKLISKLIRYPENLSLVSHHETALNAIFRTLREDFRKSIVLTTYILEVCNSYAKFEEYHDILIINKIRSVALDIIEFECGRYQKWCSEVENKRDIAEVDVATLKQKHDSQKANSKLEELTLKQNRLLKMAFDLLSNLCQDLEYLVEMLNKGMVRWLVESLDRNDQDVIKSSASLLTNMANYKEVLVELCQLPIAPRLAKILETNHSYDVTVMLLKLIFNLSFDTKIRHRMIKAGLLTHIETFLNNQGLEDDCISILYNFSTDNRIRPKMTSQILISAFMQVIFERSSGLIGVELGALALNLSAHKRCAAQMMVDNGLSLLLRQAFQNEDIITMKVIRNLAKHEGPTKSQFIEFTVDLAKALTQATAEEFVIECLGTLGNLTIVELDFQKLLIQFNLIHWLRRRIELAETKIGTPSRPKTGKSRGSSPRSPLTGNRLDERHESNLHEDSMILDVIVFIGTCSGDADCGELLIKEGIIQQIIRLLPRIGDSDEEIDIHIQIIYLFYKLCTQGKTRAYLMEQTKIPELFLDLMESPIPQIHRTCCAALDFLAEYNESWRERVKIRKFTLHNETWLEMNERGSEDPERPQMIPNGDVETPLSGEETDVYDEESRYEDDSSDTLISESDSEEGSAIEDDPRPFDSRFENVRETKSIFDQFKHQYEQEMEAKERWEFGISEDGSEDEDEDDLNYDYEDAMYDHHRSETRNKSRSKKRRATTGVIPSNQSPDTLQIHNPLSPKVNWY